MSGGVGRVYDGVALGVRWQEEGFSSRRRAMDDVERARALRRGVIGFGCTGFDTGRRRWSDGRSIGSIVMSS